MQQPLAQFPALQRSAPPLLAELLLLELDEPFELLPAELLELVFAVPDVDELLELPPVSFPPEPPEPPEPLPSPPPVECSNSPPAAQAKITSGRAKSVKVFFILAPQGPRRC